MQHNILRSSSVTKIYLLYTDNGSKKKYRVSLRFMDAEGVYFALVSSISNFKKPNKKTPVVIKAYNEDGVYSANVLLIDTEVGIRETLFKVTMPDSWTYTQLRQSSRKLIELPFVIKYNDGTEITATSYDLSLGGISFLSSEPISSIHKKVPCEISINCSEDTRANFADGVLTVNSKFCREVEDIDKFLDKTLYVFKFMEISSYDADILKKYLMQLD